MHHPPNCLYQVLLVRVYTDLQAPSTHSFLRLVLNVFFIQHIFLLLSGPQLPAVLFPSLHKSTTTCTFTHTLTTHSTLFTCCALSGQHQHHLYSHLGTHTSLSTSTDGHIHPLCPLWTTTPTPPLQSPGLSHNTSTDGCTLFTHCAPSGQHQHHLYNHPGTHITHLQTGVHYSPVVPPLDNTTSTVTRALTQVYTHLQTGVHYSPVVPPLDNTNTTSTVIRALTRLYTSTDGRRLMTYLCSPLQTYALKSSGVTFGGAYVSCIHTHAR